jgi:heptaprenyl diphosphate synthase
MEMNRMFSTRRMVFLSLLVALGTVLHVVEGIVLAPLPIPGVKPGLANIVTLFALYLYGVREGMSVAVLRVLVGSLLGGLFLSPGFFLALSGAILSTLVMAFLLRSTTCFSLVGISIAGAVGHNIGQLLAASVILQSRSVFYYLPYLLLAALPTGLFTGLILKSLLKRLEKTDQLREMKEM